MYIVTNSIHPFVHTSQPSPKYVMNHLDRLCKKDILQKKVQHLGKLFSHSKCCSCTFSNTCIFSWPHFRIW